ncbi:hypothetical protein PoB_000630700 [Plakobranchus ocellatus]|uniref:Uncharacterized protein n=1 Tax=Plakobranchus ocellatus TaxID=259542 RepID=A0AAV3YAG0_9GAST|nr:hypothetical protein PoB_000630700 [Plakobranchus ocellatus]
METLMRHLISQQNMFCVSSLGKDYVGRYESCKETHLPSVTNTHTDTNTHTLFFAQAAKALQQHTSVVYCDLPSLSRAHTPCGLLVRDPADIRDTRGRHRPSRDSKAWGEKKTPGANLSTRLPARVKGATRETYCELRACLQQHYWSTGCFQAKFRLTVLETDAGDAMFIKTKFFLKFAETYIVNVWLWSLTDVVDLAWISNPPHYNFRAPSSRHQRPSDGEEINERGSEQAMNQPECQAERKTGERGEGEIKQNHGGRVLNALACSEESAVGFSIAAAWN